MIALLLGSASALEAQTVITLAWDANETAITLERDGMRYAPLLMAQLAQHLDPANPGYAIHVADLMDINGDVDGARGVRAALQVRWRQYQRVFATPAPSDSASAVGSDSTLVPAAGSDSLAISGKVM